MMYQILGLQAFSMSILTVLAIDANQLILGAMALVSSVIATLGTVYVATRQSKQETDRIIEALQKQSLAASGDALLAARKLAAETVTAADKVSENQPTKEKE